MRTARLGGLCVVSATGLVAAGAMLARDPRGVTVMAAAALLCAPAAVLACLASQRALRRRRAAHMGTPCGEGPPNATR